MAKTAVDTIKQWFRTGLFPTQEQFWNWLDSFRHKDDSISISDVYGLTDILNNKQDKQGATVVLLPAGTNHYDVSAGTIIEKIWFQLTTNSDSISVGKSVGAADVYDAAGPDAAGNIFVSGDKIFREAATIYFTGIKSDTITLIYKR